MRKKIYQMVHVYEDNITSIVYKYFMIAVITLGLIPLTTKQVYTVYSYIDILCVSIYIIDYILRLCTADYKFNNKSWKSFARYPFRFISIIDFITIFALFCSIFNLFGTQTIAKVFSVFRIIRILRYSKGVRTIINIFKRSSKSLLAVGFLAAGYILVSAIVIFNVEPDSFNTFFDAVYWATISLTTVGYGDIYPVTAIGRAIAMISSFFGIAIVALPAGVVTAEYMNSTGKKKE